MKPLRMNADYELTLFSGREGPSIVNQSLEFLLFFLEEKPVFSYKKYSPDYLEYVFSKTHRKPEVTHLGPYENYWGLLQDIEREKWWNSKITTTQLQIEKGWEPRLKIITPDFDFNELDADSVYLIKDPNGMSGQSFQILSSTDWLIKIKQQIEGAPLIAEPFCDRVYDFSHYIYPDKTEIAYENKVDSKFQYKGSCFSNIHSPTIEGMSFFREIKSSEWEKFQRQKHELLEYFSAFPNEIGLSIDSFVYREKEELKIRTVSEVNYRRTMGRMAYELGIKYGQNFSKVDFYLLKTSAKLGPLWRRMSNQEGFLVLSPGDTRFEMTLVLSNSVNEAQERYEKLLHLMSNG